MGKGEKKHGAMARLKFKGRSDKEKKLEVKLISVKDAPMNQSELDSNCETKGMAGGREYQLASNEFNDALKPSFGGGNLSNRPSFRNIPMPLVDSYDLPRESPGIGSSGTASNPQGKSAEKFGIHPPSISSAELDKSESDNAPGIPTPQEHKPPITIQRDPKQDALVNELSQRILRPKSFSDDSTLPAPEPSQDVAPKPLIKKFSMDSELRASKLSKALPPEVTLEHVPNNIPQLGVKPSEVTAPQLPPNNFPNDIPRFGLKLSGTPAPQLPPKNFAANSLSPAVVSSSVPTQISPPERSPDRMHSNKRILWLKIENIPMTEKAQSRFFKNNDIVRWLDSDSKYFESEPPPLPVGAYLDCETWSGDLVVVPSEYARLISSQIELAELLQGRPRAQATENFVGTNDDDLSVVAGEVVYLLHECSSTHFMAMNKSITRGKVPKRVLNVLLAP